MILNTSIISAIITVFGSIIVASITYYLTKNKEIKTTWQHEKMNHYKVFLSSLSDLVTDNVINKNFYLAVNTICLVAPQYVVNSLMDFCSELMASNPNKSQEKINLLLNKLILDIRKDIGLSNSDKEDTFNFCLISGIQKR